MGLSAYRMAMSDHLLGILLTFGALGFGLVWLLRKVRKVRESQNLKAEKSNQPDLIV